MAYHKLFGQICLPANLYAYRLSSFVTGLFGFLSLSSGERSSYSCIGPWEEYTKRNTRADTLLFWKPNHHLLSAHRHIHTQTLTHTHAQHKRQHTHSVFISREGMELMLMGSAA
jgi:hypothetical protein